jgi:hypothetical protein
MFDFNLLPEPQQPQGLSKIGSGKETLRTIATAATAGRDSATDTDDVVGYATGRHIIYTATLTLTTLVRSDADADLYVRRTIKADIR